MDMIINISEEEEGKCAICMEQKDNLRMLPCWHIACMTCILGMAQAGRGRAVVCHLCREPCLFENLRSLPKPIKCKVCGNFVKNPKKFPCCSNLYCSECIAKSSSGMVACPNHCSFSLHDVGLLPKARLCSNCFALHIQNPENCGHVFCLECRQERFNQGNQCPLCVAISRPPPTPINPLLASHGQGEALLTLHMLRMLQQRNLSQQQRQQEDATEMVSAIVEHVKNDIVKGAAFFAILIISSHYYGLSFWLWVVGLASLALMRPSVICICILCLILNLSLLAASFYYYFWKSMTLVVIDTLVGVVLRQVEKTSLNRYIFWFLSMSTSLTMLISTLVYFPTIFVHRLGLVFALQNLGRFLP